MTIQRAIFIARQSPARAGYSITELMVSMTIMLIVIAIALATQMYGLRMFQTVKPKLIASDDARKTVSVLVEEVRSAHRVKVGAGSKTSFTEFAPNALQAGNALQIYAGTNAANYTRYYLDTSDRSLKRVTNGAAPIVVAQAVTNETVFTSEDFAGNVLTNNFNNRVIGVTLRFHQPHYPTSPGKPQGLYDFYQVRTRITRRTSL